MIRKFFEESRSARAIVFYLGVAAVLTYFTFLPLEFNLTIASLLALKDIWV
jgi:hypothetical protein